MLNRTEIERIEKALSTKLNRAEINILSGKETRINTYEDNKAFMILLALSECEHLNLKKISKDIYRRHQDITRDGSFCGCWSPKIFLDIREKLKNAGFKVRDFIDCE